MEWGLDDWSIDSRRPRGWFARANDDGNAHVMRASDGNIYTYMRAMRVARALGRGVV